MQLKAKKTSQSPTEDAKYIQQHLANERTYLAWLRTAIAIIGVGFLVTNLHHTTLTSISPLGDLFASLIGISSVILGILTIILATYDYLRKLTTINNQTFRASKAIILTISTFIVIIALVFGMYFLMI